MNTTLMARFDQKVKRTDGCWLWLGAKNSSGYPQLHVPGLKMRYAHRLSYEHYVGPIPAGLTLDHLCRTPACVNPAHLEPVTHLENVRRGSHATRTHCVNGHEFTPANTYVRKEGWRMCRACGRDRAARRALSGAYTAPQEASWAEGRAEANDLYLGMDWPDPPEGDDDDPEDEETGEGS